MCVGTEDGETMRVVCSTSTAHMIRKRHDFGRAYVCQYVRAMIQTKAAECVRWYILPAKQCALHVLRSTAGTMIHKRHDFGHAACRLYSFSKVAEKKKTKRKRRESNPKKEKCVFSITQQFFLKMGVHKDKILNTKVNLRSFAKLQAISQRANISIYKILQTVIDCVLKVFCEREPISDEMREVFYKFIDFDKAKNGFSFVSPDMDLQNLNMSKNLAIVTYRKKKIPEVVLIERNGEQMTENRNNDEILSVFMQAFSPKILRGLQSIMQTEKFHNLTDALFFAIHETAVVPGDVLHDEVLQIFDEANNITYTASPEFENSKDVDNMPQSRFEMKARKRPYNLSFEAQEKIRERQKQKEDCETVQYFDNLEQIENFEEE